MTKTTVPTSKTAITERIKALDSRAVLAGLERKPELIGYRDERGRNWLHLCSGTNVNNKTGVSPRNAIPLAQGLIDLGIDVNAAAFVEGSWRATALWYAVARGENYELARFLLKSGSTPEHCLWAACFRDDTRMLKLLVDGGAPLEAVAENETALLGAVKYSKFKAARFLLEAGANADYQDVKGMTALHYMLKKSSDPKHYAMFVSHGARGDIPDKSGRTVQDIMRRKRDKAYHKIAEQLASR